MLNKEKADKIDYMIKKELQRNSLEELCEYWECSVDDFYEFLECAHRYIDLRD